MATNTKAQGQTSSGLRTAAYASAVIGGGVVGLDYATWWDLPPEVGAIVGSVLSAIVTSWLLHLQADPGGEIRKGFTTFGTLAGGITGIVIGLSRVGGPEGFFGGAFGGAVLGAIAGQIVASLISLAALCLLFISRGPVGLFLRNVVLKRDEDVGELGNLLDPVLDGLAGASEMLESMGRWLA